MGASLVQTQRTSTLSGVTSVHIAFNFAVSAGNFLVAYAGTNGSGRNFTASDSVNGSWGAAADQNNSRCSILSFPNTAAGTPDVTVTVTGAATGIQMIIEEWTGVVTTSPLDVTAIATGTAATTLSPGPTAALAGSNELCLAAIELAGATSGIVNATAPFTASIYCPGNALGAANYVQPTSAAVTATFTWTTAQNCSAVIATYKTTGGGGVTVKPAQLLMGVGS